MPEEIVVIVLAAIIGGCIMITSIAKMTFSYLRDRAGVGKASGGSLTKSELEKIMRSVVEETTEPLFDKMHDLERRLDGPLALPTANPSLDLDLLGEEEEVEERLVARRRRASR